MIPAEGDNPRQIGRILVPIGLVAMVLAAVMALSLRFASPAFSGLHAALALLLTQPLAFFAIWVQAPRLAALAGPPSTTANAFWANVVSSIAFLVTPGRISEALKPVMLNVLSGTPLARGFAAVALERLLDLGCVALLAFAALLGTASTSTGQLQASAWTLLLLFCAGAITAFALGRRPRAAERMAAWLPGEWLPRMAREAITVVRETASWPALAGPIAYTILTWLASYLSLVLLIRFAGPIDLSPLDVLFVFVAGVLGMVVSVSPGGLGTYEGAIVLALAQFGYPLADALALAVLLRTATVLPAIPCAIWFLARNGMGLSGLLARTRTGAAKP